MRILGSIIFSISVLSASSLVQAEKLNYVEIGVGSTVYFSEDASSLQDHTKPLSLKSLIGGQILSSPHTWYELGFNYSTETDTNNVSARIASSSLESGVKFTTSPYDKNSVFIRTGLGRAKLTINDVNMYQSLRYIGGGISHNLNSGKSFNFEIKYTKYQDIKDGSSSLDLGNTSAFITYSQFI